MNEWNNADEPDAWTAVNAYRNQRDALQSQLDQAKRQLDALALPGRLVGALYALTRGLDDDETVRLSSLVGEALDIDPHRVRVQLGHGGRVVLDILAEHWRHVTEDTIADGSTPNFALVPSELT